MGHLRACCCTPVVRLNGILIRHDLVVTQNRPEVVYVVLIEHVECVVTGQLLVQGPGLMPGLGAAGPQLADTAQQGPTPGPHAWPTAG
jgi:hypothetical protein